MGTTARPGLQAVLLGSAQDGGIPHPACRCPQCMRAVSGDDVRRLPASLGLIDVEGGQRYLIDIAPQVTHQLELLDKAGGVGPWSLRYPVDGVFLTHGHFGHIGGLPFFGKEVAATKSLPVWCTEDLASYIQANRPYRDLVIGGHIRLERLRPAETILFASGRWSIMPIAVPHRGDVSDTVGFRIDGPARSLAYLPDIDYLIPELVELVGSVDYALIDGTFFSPTELGDRAMGEVPHPTMLDTMRQLGSLPPRKAWFIHLNHTNSAASEGSEARQRVKRSGFGVAREGQSWIL